MPDDGYFNARLRGMKTRLLAGPDYDKLLQAADTSALMEAASRTGLKPFLDVALTRAAGMEALEAASKADFAANCRKVFNIAEGGQKRFVGLLLRRWDRFNIKTLLRGKHNQTSPIELTRSLVPAGELDGPSLQELASQPGVKEVIDLLATWGHPLAEFVVPELAAYLADHNLIRLELGLDRGYFDSTVRRLNMWLPGRRLLSRLIGREIDIVNVLAKIRLVIDDIDTFVETPQEKRLRIKEEKAAERTRRTAERRKLKRPRPPSLRPPPPPPPEPVPPPSIQDYFIRGGAEFGGANLTALLRTRTMKELLDLLSASSFGRFISPDMRELGAIPDLSAFERGLETDLIKRQVALYRHEPMGMAMAASYLWMRYTQFINLRIIARGKEFGLPDSLIKNELVYAF